MFSTIRNGFLIFFSLIFGFQIIVSQNQEIADKLKEEYISGMYDKSEFRLLTEISENETNPDSSLYYANLLIKVAATVEPIDSSRKAFKNGFLTKGNALLMKGNNPKAIEAFLNSLDYAKQIKDKKAIAYIQVSIADTYSVMNNDENAKLYYEEGIKLLRATSDSLNLASALLNKGDWLFNQGKYTESLKYFKESDSICTVIDYPLGNAYNLGNIGLVYAEQGKDSLAEQNINNAISILEKLEDYYPISVYLTYLADIYFIKGNSEAAFKYARQSLSIAKEYGLKEQISDANLKLSELHENAGNHKPSLSYYKDFVIYRDSVVNIKAVQDIANEVTQRQQAELELETQKRKTQRIILWSTVGVLFLIGLIARGLYKRNKFIKATNKIIAAEKDRSDKLLLNILPEDTAQELKDKGRVEAKKFPSVTVLFSDFKGFTSYAENLSPEKLVQTIDHYFSEFDLIMEKYGLEKIKTIGDAYMAVGGLSFDNVDQAKEMILAAQEMNAFVAKAKEDDFTDATFDIRIGINTGPVVAGIVGTKKFAYDIWGDTVNIAARMESISEPGRINISEYTHNIVKSDFKCDYRGELEVKNRGKLKMYFVNS